MSKTIALFNMSGGVGKSTLTMNLSYHISHDLEKRVLLIDADPQASLTTFMGVSPFELDKTLLHSLLDKEPLPIINNEFWCDLAPANIFMSQAEIKLGSELRREYRLADAIKKVSDDYDVVLLDCPPSLGLLSVNCLVAAHYLFIPIQTEYKSVEATINLLQTTYETAQEINPDLLVAGAIPTMHDERTSQAKKALQTITDIFTSLKQNDFFASTEIFTPIPRRTDFANATAQHIPLAKLAPKHPGLKPLQEITKAIGKLL